MQEIIQICIQFVKLLFILLFYICGPFGLLTLILQLFIVNLFPRLIGKIEISRVNPNIDKELKNAEVYYFNTNNRLRNLKFIRRILIILILILHFYLFFFLLSKVNLPLILTHSRLYFFIIFITFFIQNNFVWKIVNMMKIAIMDAWEEINDMEISDSIKNKNINLIIGLDFFSMCVKGMLGILMFLALIFVFSPSIYFYLNSFF
jgi:hypothetical protein